MKVNICGIPHEVQIREDYFDCDTHMGMINYKDLTIVVNKNMPAEAMKETICHEMVHGMLLHLGYMDLCENEQLVQALGNAIYQGFEIKEV